MIDPRGLKLFIVDLAFLTLAWLFFWLRALVTVTKIRRVSLDDILMFASIVIYTAHNTISLWGIVNASQIGDGNIIAGESIALHSWFLCEVIYAPLSALIRTSIGFFLLRIATVKWHRYTIYGTLGVVWALTLPFFSLLLFQCFPPEHFYKQILPEASSGSCLEHTIVPLVTMAHSVIFSLIDFVLALFPIAILWNVQLSKRTKAGVAALLGTGVL
ncbi:putative integral membrane protein [Naviculisporaceae sp. PSN 640]